jgi:glutathione peroxidase-family protein
LDFHNFGSQEPGTNEEIALPTKLWCYVPMMDKESICAQCTILDTKNQNGLEDSDVAWNFKST